MLAKIELHVEINCLLPTLEREGKLYFKYTNK